MKSDSASSSGSVSGPPTRSSISSPERAVVALARPSRGSSRHRRGGGRRRRGSRTRWPAHPTARPIEPRPTMPTVTSRSSAPSSGCHVRSRWSSRSCGSSPADREDHHQDVLGDRPAEHAAGVGDDQAALQRRRRQGPLHARRRRVDPGQAAARGPGAGRTPPRSASRGASPRRRRAGPSARPSTETVTRRAPGAAARIRSRSRER